MATTTDGVPSIVHEFVLATYGERNPESQLAQALLQASRDAVRRETEALYTRMQALKALSGEQA